MEALKFVLMQNPFGCCTWNNDQRLKRAQGSAGHPNINVFIFLAHLHRACKRNGARYPPCAVLTLGMNGPFTHLVQLNPLLVSLGAGVGDPQGSKLGSEQVGGVLLHGGNVEAEHFGGDTLQAVGEVICRQWK